eukprot:CCRYP_015497-RA/>CCRYP_015497-RA protein AED:0.03 eAED:0.03 QI:391/1/1/1/1/1/2/352/317
MTPSEPKLKRSPYLSQMTREADRKLTAIPSTRPGGEVFSWDFFELKRPSASVRREQNSSDVPAASRIPLTVEESLTADMKRDTSSVDTQLSIDDQTSLNGRSTRTPTGNPPPLSVNDLDRSRVISPDPYRDESSQSISTRSLQYFYKPALKPTTSLLLKRRPARVLPFRDMLDEGDGKEGDWNVLLRNEQWKTFMDGKMRKLPRHLHHNRRQQGERDLSATDLAVLRRAACRKNMNWVKSGGKPGESLGGPMLSSLSHGRNEFVRSSSTQFMPVDHSKTSIERMSVPILKQRGSTASAGLAYGSEIFQMLKNETLEV